jgi:hypothetical protein
MLGVAESIMARFDDRDWNTFESILGEDGKRRAGQFHEAIYVDNVRLTTVVPAKAGIQKPFSKPDCVTKALILWPI